MWFVPTIFWISIVSWIIEHYVQKEIIKDVLTIFTAFVAVFLFLSEKNLPGYMNYILLFLPIFRLGVVARKKKLHNLINEKWFIPVGIIIILLNALTGMEIEVTKGKIYGGAYYFLAILGLIFVISLSKNVKESFVSSLLVFFGINSFYIMAFHFIGFKMIDGIIGMAKKDLGNERLMIFPFSFPKLRWVYFIFGIVFSIGIKKINDGLKVITRKNINNLSFLEDKKI